MYLGIFNIFYMVVLVFGMFGGFRYLFDLEFEIVVFFFVFRIFGFGFIIFKKIYK